MEDEMRYNCKQLLDLLSIYEGELQAREALIEALQGQQDQYLQQSSSTIQSMIKHDSFNSVLRDSQQIERFVHCASCSNRMLHTAKIMQIQRDSDRKLNKAINLLNKRYAKINQEIDSKERRLGTMAKDNEKYIKSLEAERDDCHDQLKKQQNEFAELQEKKAEIDDKFMENDERTKEIILYLLRERNQLFEHLNELQKQIDNSQPVAGPSSILDESKTQIHALKEENRRLQSQLASVQTEKGSLQKRLDYLLKDLQQSAFHQHFQFLQPKGPAEKELIIIGNGLISPTEPFHGPNRIRNSSSFPQSFGGNDPSIRFASSSDGNGTGRSRMPQQFPTNHFEQRQSGMQNSMTSGGPIPLMASNSTMIMRRLPPPVPRTTAQPMPTTPSNQQEYRRPSNEQYPQQKSTLNTTNIQLGQPQTVITRRSTSLPRRIVSSTTVSPSSKQHSLQHNRKEPSAEHFFYHQQQGGGQGIVSPMDDGNGSHQKQHFVNNHFI